MINCSHFTVCIQEPCVIDGADQIIYNGNVHIGHHTEIMAEGGLTIGNNVVISYHCVLWTIDHNYESDRLPYGFGRIKRPIVIKDNVWIGRNAMVRGGVTIGEGAVVAMGSVVTRNVPPLSVVAGNPARIVKFRNVKRYMAAKASGATLWQQAHGKCGACQSDQFHLVSPTEGGVRRRFPKAYFPIWLRKIMHFLFLYWAKIV